VYVGVIPPVIFLQQNPHDFSIGLTVLPPKSSTHLKKTNFCPNIHTSTFEVNPIILAPSYPNSENVHIL
jgi:hypothetical protein